MEEAKGRKDGSLWANIIIVGKISKVEAGGVPMWGLKGQGGVLVFAGEGAGF